MNWSAALVALVPPGVVTLTSTVPTPTGETAVMLVSELNVKLVAAVPPKRTAVTPVNPVPERVSVVLPAVGPEVGLIEVTIGVAI